MRLLDVILSLLIPSLVILHLLAAPYTKVEESFNIQAAHDILVYGTPTSNIGEKLRNSYDHFSFPGAVPRTFIGPVLLAGISQPIVALVGFQYAQLVVRSVLGLFNAFSLYYFTRNIGRAFGIATARWYILLQASQFHIIFYASRTLPNMLAFGLTTFAFSFLLPHPDPKTSAPRQRLAISLFVFAAVIFRSELAILLGTSVLYLLIIPVASLQRLVKPFIVAVVMSLVVSVPIDSYFWQKPLWPELWGFYYNAVLGSSSDWGVSPWHYYITSALPRLLMNPLLPLLLIPVALSQPATSRAALQLVVPSLSFVAIYSLQPHKEARFIFYVVPPLTAAAALGANFIFTRRNKTVLLAVASLALVVSIMLSFAASTAVLLFSSLNYPGGEALAQLRDIVRRDGGSSGAVVPVHADVLACMTGVTLFETEAAGGMPAFRAGGSGNLVGNRREGASAVSLALDKTEDRVTLRDPKFWQRFDYLLVEDPARVRGGRWEVIGVVEGYAGVEILRPGAARAHGGVVDGSEPGEKVVGRGAAVASIREYVRRITGGWWAGPRMEPRIRILKRVRDTEKKKEQGANA